jgi:hypothetical protein
MTALNSGVCTALTLQQNNLEPPNKKPHSAIAFKNLTYS